MPVDERLEPRKACPHLADELDGIVYHVVNAPDMAAQPLPTLALSHGLVVHGADDKPHAWRRR